MSPIDNSPSWPWWRWPNVLALDAPVIAVVWQRLLARPAEPNHAESWALFFAVWAIYLIDRLWDARAFRHLSLQELPLRHQFFRLHRRGILVCLGITLSAGLSAAIFLPWSIWWKGGALAVVAGGYLFWNQAGARAPARKFAKEWIVAALFAVGCGLVSLPVIPMETWLAGVTVLTLCAWLNCLQIAAMEQVFDQRTGMPSWAAADRSKRIIFRFLPWSMVILFGLLIWMTGNSGFLFSGWVAAGMLCFTGRMASRRGSEWGGTWADAALVFPAALAVLVA